MRFLLINQVRRNELERAKFDEKKFESRQGVLSRSRAHTVEGNDHHDPHTTEPASFSTKGGVPLVSETPLSRPLYVVYSDHRDLVCLVLRPGAFLTPERFPVTIALSVPPFLFGLLGFLALLGTLLNDLEVDVGRHKEKTGES